MFSFAVPGPTHGANVAVTESWLVGVRVQDAVPLHAPVQPVKVDPALGVAVSVTVVPVENTPVQSDAQFAIAEVGLLETLPEPANWTVTSGGSFHALGGV